MRRLLIRSIMYLIFVSHNPISTSAGVIYESGSLGPTGVTYADLSLQESSPINLNEFLFVGAKFEIENAIQTTQIGGHFLAQNVGVTFFGAIVSLSGEADLPNTPDLSSPDVLGTTQLTIPESSGEVFGGLTLTLQSGWYAVVFGSGLFETSGRGVALGNGFDNDTPSYIEWEINLPGTGWSNFSALQGHEIFSNYHFIVEGANIPEPSTFLLLITCGAFTLFHRHSA